MKLEDKLNMLVNHCEKMKEWEAKFIRTMETRRSESLPMNIKESKMIHTIYYERIGKRAEARCSMCEKMYSQESLSISVRDENCICKPCIDHLKAIKNPPGTIYDISQDKMNNLLNFNFQE